MLNEDYSDVFTGSSDAGAHWQSQLHPPHHGSHHLQSGIVSMHNHGMYDGAGVTTYGSYPSHTQRFDLDDVDAPRGSYVPWTEYEDMRLRAVVEDLRARGETDEPDSASSTGKDGSANSKSKFWTKVSFQIHGRTAKQCRERWKNSLDPTIAHSPWNIEEDLMLQLIQAELGNKWSQIAARMPGRTENGVKTRFKSIMRAKKRQWTSQEDALLLQLYRQHGPKWNLIQNNLQGRSLHGVKVRYRALISGSTHKSVTLGSPEQSLPYDFRTYFDKKPSTRSASKDSTPQHSPQDPCSPYPPSNTDDAKSTHKPSCPSLGEQNIEKTPSTSTRPVQPNVPCAARTFVGVMDNSQHNAPERQITKKRILIEALLHDSSPEDDTREVRRQRLANGPCIIPGFSVPALPPPKSRALTSSLTHQHQESQKPQVVHQSPSKNASVVKKEHLAALKKGPKPQHKVMNISANELSGLPPEDKNFANTMSDILLNAKSHADDSEIDMEEFHDFQSSIADILNDEGNLLLF